MAVILPPDAKEKAQIKASLAIWPELMRPLLAQHGEDVLNQVSLDVLGYPALLITHAYERDAVAAAIAKRQPKTEKVT